MGVCKFYFKKCAFLSCILFFLTDNLGVVVEDWRKGKSQHESEVC